MALSSDHWIFVLKAVLYLVMTGLKPDPCPIISDALCKCCFGIAFSACALMFFVSLKSAHGIRHAVVRWIWLILLEFSLVAGLIMYLIQEPRQSYNSTVILIALAIMSIQIAQALYPLFVRSGCMGEPNFVDDENIVVAIKSVACLIIMSTSIFDTISYWSLLNSFVTLPALCSHRAMCTVGSLAALIQLVTRIVSVMNRIKAALKKIKDAWDSATNRVSSAWKAVVAFLGGIYEYAAGWCS